MRARGEDGAALVLALIFLSLFGLFSGVLLGFSETGVRTTQTLRTQTQKIYAMEGAVDTAVNAMRGDITAGRDPAVSPLAHCDSYQATGGGQTMTATCQAEPGSGGAVGGGLIPDHGILTLSTDATEHGIHQVSDVAVQVNGSIFSNTNILNSGTASVMTVNGTVEALGTCVSTSPASQMISTQGALRCSNTGGGADPAHGVDPLYQPAALAAPAWRPVPACAAGVITFSPGTYDDAVALSALTNGSCANATIHLAPDVAGVGVYYFDFRNSGSHEWVISDPTVRIVGGTKKNWVDLGAAVPPIIPFPGGCKVDTDSGTKDGVQLIFGSDSRVNMSAGTMELCPQPAVAAQEISIYGLRSGTATAVTAASPSTAHSGVSNVTTPQNGYAIEGAGAPQYATFTTTPLLSSATTTYTGTLPIPQGSFITSSRLRLAHSGTGSANVSITVALSAIPGADSVSPGAYGAYREDLLALTRTGRVGASLGFSIGITTSTVLSSSTWQLDGAVLEVTYEAPSFRAQSGCIVLRYEVGVSGCPVLRGTSAGRIAIQGTVYTPVAPIDVNVINVSAQIFNRGVVSRVIRFGVVPVGGFSGTVSGLVRNDRVVTYSVISGPTTLKVRVRFDDDGGITPGRTVTVERFSVRR
jgi:hypothetical protein